MFNIKATEGIAQIRELLDMKEASFAYVSNPNTLYKDEGQEYVVPNGVPICYIRNGGFGGFMIEIARQNEDFVIELEYEIRVNGTLEQAQKVQNILNEVLMKRDYNDKGISFDLDGNRYESGKLYNVYVKKWNFTLEQLEQRAKMLNFHFESDGHKSLTFRNLSSMAVLRLHNRLCKPNGSMVWMDSVVE